MQDFAVDVCNYDPRIPWYTKPSICLTGGGGGGVQQVCNNSFLMQNLAWVEIVFLEFGSLNQPLI
jgi:hypothetical protein